MKQREIQFDFSDVNSLDEMHDILAYSLQFPDSYGRNVHALIDCLSSLRFP